MLAEPRCFTRSCKHYRGVVQPDGTEMTEVDYCEAFPKGIPIEISHGDDPHSRPLVGQGNEIIYEFGDMP